MYVLSIARKRVRLHSCSYSEDAHAEMDSEDLFAEMGYTTGETQSRKTYPIPVQGIQGLLQI